MAEILVKAEKQVLQEAHRAYMEGDIAEYNRKMEEARVILYAMREENALEEEEGKIIRFMAWKQEYRFVSCLAEQKNLPRLVQMYQGVLQDMFLRPSQIIKKEAPFLPPGEDIYDFYAQSFRGDEWTAELLGRALEVYSLLTGGGGAGYEEMYRAEAAFRKREYQKAREYIQQVQDSGNVWLKESAENFIKKLDMTDQTLAG